MFISLVSDPCSPKKRKGFIEGSRLWLNDVRPNQTTGSFIIFDQYTLQLAEIAAAYGQDLFIVQAIGIMNATLVGDSCVNASYVVEPKNLQLLQQLAQKCVQLRMVIKCNFTSSFIRIHVLKIEDTFYWNSGRCRFRFIVKSRIPPIFYFQKKFKGPFEWTSCMHVYASMNVEVAIQIEKLLSPIENLNWNWYVAQEADITALSDDPSQDGETIFFNLLIEGIRSNTKPRDVLASPYITDVVNLPNQARKLMIFTKSIPNLSWIAPQDGVGSWNYSVKSTHDFFMYSNQYFSQNNLVGKLWANCESFLPHAQICKACSEERYRAQVEAVNQYVSNNMFQR